VWNYSLMLNWFEEPRGRELLRKAVWGIEREAQRVTKTGDLALTSHPIAFGDKLTNPSITTDFAESQLELITSPFDSIEAAHAELARIHDEVEAALGDELLWPYSMPPRLPHEDLIPIARYNDTEEGRANAAYRQSLAERYGKKMQMISGLHVNFSFPSELLKFIADKLGIDRENQELANEIYFAMARNVLRYRWLLIYLFGASPSIHQSYDSVVCDELNVIKQCCPACCPTIGQYEKYATSLRVSRYGYSNTNQRDVTVSFDSLEAHVASFKALLKTTLMKESEFYCSIRLKPLAVKGKGYLEALESHGVRYAELRMMDLNPYIREGISIQQLKVLHVFMLWCLFEQSPPVTDEEVAWSNENHHTVSLFGRKPGLQLQHYKRGRGQVPLTTWMDDIFTKMKQVAKLLDCTRGDMDYQEVIEAEYEKVWDIERIPSAVMVKDMKENGKGFIEFGIHLAKSMRQKNAVGVCQNV